VTHTHTHTQHLQQTRELSNMAVEKKSLSIYSSLLPISGGVDRGQFEARVLEFMCVPCRLYA